ncbi:hypothetical protein DXT89_20810 [Agrobacterium vitis]|uniref:Uncharacterized protein n=1 Tax=Agrobacterium vitis TaxID=373 RepID=A0A368NNK1_AGRVI|nr:hypothetical protein DXM22_19760 [Agrobacterium vitis]KAA3523396.1 hypothetical protein DXT89_20810 [Agrobacterium vitis]RCU51244.1 hypothetical protein ASB66_019955 [Agrobacterium vitis]
METPLPEAILKIITTSDWIVNIDYRGIELLFILLTKTFKNYMQVPIRWRPQIAISEISSG